MLLLLLSRFSCVWLWDPMDCSLPGFSVHGILQARTLEWVAISFSILNASSNYMLSNTSVLMKNWLWEWLRGCWKITISLMLAWVLKKYLLCTYLDPSRHFFRSLATSLNQRFSSGHYGPCIMSAVKTVCI